MGTDDTSLLNQSSAVELKKSGVEREIQEGLGLFVDPSAESLSVLSLIGSIARFAS